MALSQTTRVHDSFFLVQEGIRTIAEWTPSRKDTIWNVHHPECTPSRVDTIPNVNHPECTQSRIAQSRMDTIPNEHIPSYFDFFTLA